MKKVVLMVVVLGTALLTACAGAPIAEIANDAPAAYEPEPLSKLAEIPVSIPPATTEPTSPLPLSQDTEPFPEESPPADESGPVEADLPVETEPPAPSSPKVGNMAPDFTLLNSDGKASLLSDIGRPTILNFWNTGCQPCRNEMPYLEAIYERERDAGLLVLAINIGQNPSSVQAFLEDNDLHLPVAFDTSATLARAYEIQYIPTTFFVDSGGIIRGKQIGSFRDELAIEKKLATIMPDSLD